MPVVNGKSNLFAGDVDPARARGRPITVQASVFNGATDSAGSTYLLCRLPSAAILTASTTFKADGWGFAVTSVGTLTDVDALFQANKNAAHAPITRNAAASHGKPLWELLGLASDPGGEIALYAHGIADAAAAGSMNFEIHYLFR